MTPQTTFEREPARRVFASELRETRYQFKDGDDEKSPTYVILPTGIRSNRIFIVGTLTEKRQAIDIFYRGRVVDPTGLLHHGRVVRPGRCSRLADRAACIRRVVGKPNLYTTPGGTCLVSVGESISVVDGKPATSGSWMPPARPWTAWTSLGPPGFTQGPG